MTRETPHSSSRRRAPSWGEQPQRKSTSSSLSLTTSAWHRLHRIWARPPRGGPEGETQVGIKGDGPAQLPGVGHRGPGGGSGGLVSEAEGAEVEETAALDEGAVHLLPPELGVRPRLACKAEGAVPRGI